MNPIQEANNAAQIYWRILVGQEKMGYCVRAFFLLFLPALPVFWFGIFCGTVLMRLP